MASTRQRGRLFFTRTDILETFTAESLGSRACPCAVRPSHWRCMDPTPKLNAALVEAQKMLEPVKKAAVNPFFTTATRKATYAELCDVLDAILPALNGNGIALTQFAKNDADGVGCITQLRHVSGEMAESTFWVPVTKKDPQGYGSAFTYARRFGAKAAVGLAEEDDDGNSHAIDPKAKTAADYAKKKDAPTVAQVAKLVEAFAGLGVTVEAVEKRLGHSPTTLTLAEYDSLKAWGAELKAKAKPKTPDEIAQDAVKAQAEAAFASAEKSLASPAAKPSTVEANATFKSLAERINAAPSEADALLIQAEAVKLNLPKSDMAALGRAAKDRACVLSELRKGPAEKRADDVNF